MGNFIDLKAADGFVFPAYVAQPAGAPKGGIVVVKIPARPFMFLPADWQKVTREIVEEELTGAFVRGAFPLGRPRRR